LETEPCTLRVALSFWANPAGAHAKSSSTTTIPDTVRIM
jgi:hypothetical protein